MNRSLTAHEEAIDRAAEFVRLQLEQGHRCPLTLSSIQLLEPPLFEAVHARLSRQVNQVGPPNPLHDALLLLWMRGLPLSPGPRQASDVRLLSMSLSVGLRSNAFPALVEGFAALKTNASLATDWQLDSQQELEIHVKYARLLKRKGLFSQSLGVLADLAMTGRKAGTLAPLVCTDLLHAVAKSLGSHQSRMEQCILLTDFGIERAWQDGIGMALSSKGEAPQNWLAKTQTLIKTLDFNCRQRWEKCATTPGNKDALQQVYWRWAQAARMDKEIGKLTSRTNFARLIALTRTSKNPARRELYWTQFEQLLTHLSWGEQVTDRRALAVRFRHAAEIERQYGTRDMANYYAATALRNAEEACDWPSIAKILLLQSELAYAAPNISPPERVDWSCSLIEQATRALEHQEERPVGLLLEHCRLQTRLYLSLGNTRSAVRSIELSLAYLEEIRKSLRLENWVSSNQPPHWSHGIASLLTPKERGLMQQALTADWDRLISLHNELHDMVDQVNDIGRSAMLVTLSSVRADALRKAVIHTVSNVVTRKLLQDVTDAPTASDNAPLPRSEIKRAIHELESVLRLQLAEELGPMGNGIEPTLWHDIRLLATPKQGKLSAIRIFAPRVQVDCIANRSFHIQGEPVLFEEMMLVFLMNAAQQIGDRADGQITIEIDWSPGGNEGWLEVRDNVGNVDSLREAVSRTQEMQHEGQLSGGWGLPYALKYFKETWDCTASVHGESGRYSVLRLAFRSGARVQRFNPSEPLSQQRQGHVHAGG